MSYTLGEIAEISGAELKGDPGATIEKVAPLISAVSSEISFLANKRHVRYLDKTGAAAVILANENASRCPVDTLVCQDPYLAFVKVLRYMHPAERITPGKDPNAYISSSARVDDSSSIAAGVHIGSNSSIAALVSIGPGCVIGEDVEIGEGSMLATNVTICKGTVIGKDCILHPGVVVGSDGFGIVKENDDWLKIPQIAAVKICDRVEIGANTTIDRGALEDTVIEEGVKLDNQIQVGHGVRIGAHTAIAACVGIAGSSIIGKRCMIGGHSAISGHIEIADDVIITGMSGVSNSIKSAGSYSSGIPVTESRKWRKNIARFKNLDDIARRVMELEKKLDDDTSNG